MNLSTGCFIINFILLLFSIWLNVYVKIPQNWLYYNYLINSILFFIIIYLDYRDYQYKTNGILSLYILIYVNKIIIFFNIFWNIYGFVLCYLENFDLENFLFLLLLILNTWNLYYICMYTVMILFYELIFKTFINKNY